MYDRELVLDILRQVFDATQKITSRFASIKKAEDFNHTQQGMEKLDSICMQLITLGESIKNLDKITNNLLLLKYPQIDWKGVKGLRDIISHHYFDIDAEQIFWVCNTQIKLLAETIRQIISDLEAT